MNLRFLGWLSPIVLLSDELIRALLLLLYDFDRKARNGPRTTLLEHRLYR